MEGVIIFLLLQLTASTLGLRIAPGCIIERNVPSAGPDGRICKESTCGTNAHCTTVSGRPVCCCFQGYVGDPFYNCKRIECIYNFECSSHLACRKDICVDPCLDFCGVNAQCETRNHVPICSCPAGYTGEPSNNCTKFDSGIEKSCHPSPCGTNAQCELVDNVPTCKCLSGYQGSPISGCRVECQNDSECENHLTCRNDRCVDPCQGVCGANANCETRNHVPICFCPIGYTGSNPYTNCRKLKAEELCQPRTCGPYAKCDVVNNAPKCTCLPGYYGSPILEYSGDPFINCRRLKSEELCHPSPCGPNEKCDVVNNDYKCTCLTGYDGSPIAGCVMKCQYDSECEKHLACRNDRCVDPCQGVCGANANCETKNNIPICFCPIGYSGSDPYTNCRRLKAEELCQPRTCGPYAKCDVVNNAPKCTCLPGYYGSPILEYAGDPFIDCRKLKAE